MKLMLDNSIAKINAWSEMFDQDILQLRTPLTRYASHPNRKYGLENGAYTTGNPMFNTTWWRMAKAAQEDENCIWIVAPDAMGDWKKTLRHFDTFTNLHKFPKTKLAIVLQDWCDAIPNGHDEVPWDDIVCVFVGGTDKFKYSRQCMEICEEAKRRGKWVHVGRVNTVKNIVYWYDIADSFDGSGIAKYDLMLVQALQSLEALEGTHQLKLMGL